MDEAAYGYAMIRKMDRHGERQNDNQRCYHHYPMTFDDSVRRESDRSSESCDATCRGVKCRIQWSHWAPIDFSLRPQ
jgi:hypothetical protein